jgi:5-methylcytosine-specific restriction enzyme subunit McrC
MMGEAAASDRLGRKIGRIPVRNLWLLLLYASDMAHFFGRFDAEVEESPEVADLVARLLAHAVEQRLRRNLSRGYVCERADLTRLRGRIDLVRTYSREMFDRGQVACVFDEHTIDTPRNRLVRAALDAVSGYVHETKLAHRCRTLAGDLGRLGVGGLRPSRAEITTDRIGRHDANDLLMVRLSRMVFDLVLPCEEAGRHALTQFECDQHMVRQLFEKAVGNFYAIELNASDGWRVFQGRRLHWPISASTSGLAAIMPGMKTDIILDNEKTSRRIVIDTKFTDIVTHTEYRDAVLKSGYLYQIYAYLRSQESGPDPLWDKAGGVLLHPTIDIDVDEVAVIQNHKIRFVTVDLARPSDEILSRLRALPRTISALCL